DGFDTSVCAVPESRSIFFLRQSAVSPPRIYRQDLDVTDPEPLTFLDNDPVADCEMNPVEEFTYEGAENTEIHGFILKPPGFDPGRKYPTVFLVHGGPQAAWGDEFHDRWNAQIFAGWGYVIVMINPRGSTGYGDRLKEQVSCDWGGRFYKDLTRGFEFVLDAYPFIDPEKLAVAGGSVGGYMANWLAGHTGMFQCLVTHGSIFNNESFAYSTEEHWFVEWEFGGRHWDTVETQRRWSPHLHVRNFKTPILVLHGEKDFRCPYTEGIQVFTAARLKGVPARMVIFPDEGHWILKPRNRQKWYGEIRSWFEKYLN
ncbi:alpha/beta hydrolase family protein, partial [Acidobacteriota bacterium]